MFKTCHFLIILLYFTIIYALDVIYIYDIWIVEIVCNAICLVGLESIMMEVHYENHKCYKLLCCSLSRLKNDGENINNICYI